MTLVQGPGHLCRERLSVAPSIALLDFSSPSKSGDKLFDQPTGPSGTKFPVADTPVATTNVPKYSEDDLQRIFKAVLEAQALTSAPALALIISKVPQEKLKARSLDVYRG